MGRKEPHVGCKVPPLQCHGAPWGVAAHDALPAVLSHWCHPQDVDRPIGALRRNRPIGALRRNRPIGALRRTVSTYTPQECPLYTTLLRGASPALCSAARARAWHRIRMEGHDGPEDEGK